ncbi:stromal interaction molecule homolog isoform X1 [Limulus polyphemus]|uniref:Stromal interaction molecule homolog isoform X1 n=1 Tax=Limulus polyphemus TaxID=6850 RepID=A0ABM1B8J9_LIMPO|nr:stromal interaction molecule homolog isoform X1 [Limulus polyphemus]
MVLSRSRIQCRLSVLMVFLTCRLLLQTEPALSAVLAREQQDRNPQSRYTSTENSYVKGIDCKDLPGACADIPGLEAIITLHQKLDDDANGSVDVAESDEFLRDELHYENGYERQKGFHGNDKYISVDELWKMWKLSEVHNWTVEDIGDWLISHVELPQYIQNFQKRSVNGATLPRMAVNDQLFMTSLGIKDPIHKQKLALKAMDVVLFGPPRYYNYLKDILLVLSLVIATGGCWFAYVQHKFSQKHLQKMMRDLQSLQQAEETLVQLQEELYKARQEQKNVAIEKQNLEKRLQDEKDIFLSKTTTESESTTPENVQQLKEELEKVREDLRHAEKILEASHWSPPPALQLWLQLTHELELRHYNAKKTSAEQHLANAKEGCEKLRKRRTSLLGAFRVAHGSTIDAIDHRILQAKAALSEVTKDFQERLYRWQQIEQLCSFPIVHNPGLKYLESKLQKECMNGLISYPYYTGKHTRTGSESTLLDEDSSSFGGGVGAVHQLVHNSAALFLSPVPPVLVTPISEHSMLKLPSRHLPKRDSSTSLISAGQLSAFLTPDGSVANGTVTSLGLPSYSRTCFTSERPSTPAVTSTSKLMTSVSTNALLKNGSSLVSGGQSSCQFCLPAAKNENLEECRRSKSPILHSSISAPKLSEKKDLTLPLGIALKKHHHHSQ